MIEYKDIYIRPLDSRKKPYSSCLGGCCVFVPAFLIFLFFVWAGDGFRWPFFESSINLLIHGAFVPNNTTSSPMTWKTILMISFCLALPFGFLGWKWAYRGGIDTPLTPAEKAFAEEVARNVETEILNGTFTEPQFVQVVQKQISHWEYDIRKLYHTSLTKYQQLPVRAPDDPPPVSSDQLR